MSIENLLATVNDETATPRARYAACREIDAATQRAIRGGVADLVSSIASSLGVSVAEARENPWLLADKVHALMEALQIEEILETVGEVPRVANALSAAQRARVLAVARRGHVLGGVVAARASAIDDEGGIEPEAVEEFAEGMLELGRTILDEPDADAEEVLAALEAQEAELAAALEDDDDEASREQDDDEGDDDEGDDDEGDKKPDSMSGRVRTLRRRVRSLRRKVALFEARERLDAELSRRGKSIPAAKRDAWAKIAAYTASGEVIVKEFLDLLDAPPTEPPGSLPAPGPRAPAPTTVDDAFAACMEAARSSLPTSAPLHLVRANAQRIAKTRWPELFPTA